MLLGAGRELVGGHRRVGREHQRPARGGALLRDGRVRRRSTVDDNLCAAPGCTWGWTRSCPGIPGPTGPTTRCWPRPRSSRWWIEVRQALFDGGMSFQPALPASDGPDRDPGHSAGAGRGRAPGHLAARGAARCSSTSTPRGRCASSVSHSPGAVDATESRLALADFAEMGKLGVHPEVVLQSLLASAAFPVAFRPRVLCECATDCGPDPEAAEGICPGPQGTPLTGLSCQAQSAAQGGRALKSAGAASWTAASSTTRRWGSRWSSPRPSSVRG